MSEKAAELMKWADIRRPWTGEGLYAAARDAADELVEITAERDAYNNALESIVEVTNLRDD